MITGEAWVVKEKDQMKLRQFAGNTEVKNGPSTHEVLAQGFENWWTLAGEGIMRPMRTRSIMPAWNHFMLLPGLEAKEKIAHYRELWKEAVEQSADLYQEQLQRRIASVEQGQDQAAARSAAKIRNQANLRRLFRERYYRP